MGRRGELCSAGSAILVANRLALAVDLTAVPARTGVVAVAAGETRYFQAWYRDVVAGAPTSNFTTGLAVQFH